MNKLLQFLLIIFLFYIVNILCLPQIPADDKSKYCNISGSLVPPGTVVNLKDPCITTTCEGPFVSALACAYAVGLGCYYAAEDNSKPYPYCCPDLIYKSKYCYIGGELVAPGTEIDLKDPCTRNKCNGPDVISVTCPSVEDLGCYGDKEDTSRPYPFCCQDFICEFFYLD